MKNLILRFSSRVLIISMTCMTIWMPIAQASLITSEQIIGVQSAQQNREHVREFFNRTDVQAQLQARGISTEAAKTRVDAMTDNEIATINGHLDTLPAGGDSILGFLLFIFIVLLITDILGFTKVFTFTRSIR